jgi:RNA polymerase sigma-70 factor, ECF subfamily
MSNDVIRRCLDGDEEAWNEIHRQFGELIFGYCYARTRNVHDAEDISSDVWLRVFRGLPKFRGDSGLKTWLLTIAHSALIDWVRRVRARPMRDDSGGRDPEDEQDPLDKLAAPGPAPDADEESRERITAIESVLAQISAGCREIFDLARMELSGQEMAEILGEKESTLSARLSRCRDKARALLQEKELLGRLSG